MPANESTKDYLNRRDRELSQLVESVRSKIAPKQRELDDIERLKMTLASSGNFNLNALAIAGLMGSSADPSGDDATLQSFVVRRERELVQQIAAIRGEIAPIEKELTAIQKAKRTLGMGIVSNSNQVVAVAQRNSSGIIAEVAREAVAMAQAYANMSIKQLVLRSLGSGHFREGATPAELRQFMKNAYGREIPSQSLSPQLSRLKADQKVHHDEGADKWSITLSGAALVNANLPDEVTTARTQDDEVAQEDCLSFTVAKEFKSLTRRFRPGTKLEFNDPGALELFKQSLVPFNFDHLVKRGFLEPEDRKQS